ncbi:MAG: DUF11 domain-containing protein [Ardenticatenaceae bacterium]|nr:DUF11 domain-containing protein [Ardenticatenaceae bacterium]
MTEFGEFVVNGRLQTNGTLTQPVTFTHAIEDGATHWNGLIFDGGEGHLENTIVRDGVNNITVLSPTTSLYLTNTQLIDGLTGLSVQGGSVTAVCSTFANNSGDGVTVLSGGNPNVTMHSSNFLVNGGAGLNNTSGMPVNALNNWWGAANGPGGAGPGSGDEVSGNVFYTPWLTTPLCAPTVTADLSVTISASPSAVLAGTAVTYTLTVSNSGPVTASNILLSNSLPLSTTLIGPPPAACTGSSTLTCDLGSLAVGDSQVISYQVLVAPTVSGTISNTAAVSAATLDLDIANNQASVSSTVWGLPHLSFAPVSYSQPEAQTTAVLTVKSNLPVMVTATVLYETQDGTAVAGSDYVATTGILTFTPGSSSVSFPITLLDDALLEPDESLTLTLSSPTNSGLGMADQASFTILNDDSASADVSIAITVSETPLLAGQIFSYSLHIHNTGPQTATAVILTNTLPVAVSLIGSPPPNCTGITTLICTLDLISANGDVLIGYPVLLAITATDVITTQATVAAAEWDGNPANNTAVLTTPVIGLPHVQFGQASTSQNEGQSPLFITVTLDSPAVLTSTIFYTTTPGTAVPDEDYLPISGTITFTPGMTTAVQPLTLLDNSQHEPDETFLLSLAQPQYLLLGTLTTTTVTILDDDEPTADLGVGLAASSAAVLMGESLTYTVIISNSGPNAATAVSLTNHLPAETTLLTTPPNCTGTTTLTCTWPTVAADSSLSFTYQVVVDGVLTGVITNSVTITAVTPDPNPGNNTAVLITTILNNNQPQAVYLPFIRKP